MKKSEKWFKDLGIILKMECEFCKKILSSIYSLKTHQKTVKSCLQKQGKINLNFNCEYCLHPFNLEWDTTFLTW